MTIRLLSPGAVRMRCDDVARSAGIACACLLLPAFVLMLAGFPKLATVPTALAVACLGVVVGAQLVARRVR